MLGKATKYKLLLMLMFLVSCIKQISVPIRKVPPELVVEGEITTDSIPYLVNLSYSGPYTNASQAMRDSQYFISDAKVFIVDNLGDSTACTWVGSGTYQSTDSTFIGTVGRTYTLKVSLSNGKTYLSKPETITPVPPIDSLTLFYDTTFITDVRPNQYIISVHTHDPPGTQNFYRWTAYGYIARKSWGGTCLPTPYWGPCGDPISCLCHAECDQYVANDQANIASDKFIDGREIIQPAYYIPIYWFGKDFIQVNQYSISQDAYQFWEQYQAQTNRTGGILDPLPASLVGNMYNQADSTDVPLGLFSASAVSVRRIVIVPYNLQQYWLASIASQFIQPGDCQVVYPNALPDDTDPPGWENVQVISLH